MGIYTVRGAYRIYPDQPPIVPYAFLSLGVERCTQQEAQRAVRSEQRVAELTRRLRAFRYLLGL